MTKTVTAALTATALIVAANAAHAANVCQWTGHDWACGDGNIIASHVSQVPGPPMIVTPVRTVQSNEKPLLVPEPRPQQ